MLCQILLYLPAADPQQGADDAAPYGRDAAQTACAAAPDEIEKQGFGVVLKVVGRGDTVKAQPLLQRLQKAVAQQTGRLLDAKALFPCIKGHIVLPQHKGDVLALAVAFYKESVAHRYSTADAVFEVGGMDMDAGGVQQMQQAHGICAARDGTDYFFAPVWAKVNIHHRAYGRWS